MSYLFYGCKNLISLNVQSFVTSNVLDMKCMFYQLHTIQNLNLTNFDTSKVTDMSYMFYECQNISYLDLSVLKTSSVEDISVMFYGCYNLERLDLTNFDTRQVTNMEHMFHNCYSLNYLNLSSFNTTNVESMTYLFGNCNSLTSLEIKNFDTSSVIDMESLFDGCNSLVSLDLSNFNTEKVKNMAFMFYDCENLKYLDVSSFNTKLVEKSEMMFAYCYSLPSLNLSNFNTSELTSFNGMFHSCVSLTSLDISNFNTQYIEEMEELFFNCSSLLSLNLSNFDTTYVSNMAYMFAYCEKLEELIISDTFDTNVVENMEEMFANCRSLTSLDLINFNTSSVTKMNSMFSGCEKLSYINFTKYNEKDDVDISNILDLVPENIAICVNEDSQASNLKALLSTKSCALITCSNSWKSLQKKIVVENGTCVDNCSNYKYEYDNKCYSTCPEGVDFCQLETSIIESTNKDSTYKKEETSYIISTNNYKSQENIEEITNINTNSNTKFHSNIINLIDENIIKTSSKINYESSFINGTYMTKESLTVRLENNPKEENQIIYQEIISDKMRNYNISEGEEIIVEGKDNFFYQITTSENDKDYLDENNNKSNKFSKIDLGDCENLLKEHYHINKNTSLIIVKFEKMTNISTDRALQYEVYDPFDRKKLNLSICQNTSIDIYVPIILSNELQNLYNDLKDKGYDLFDEKSAFYQDICTPFKSPNGTDVLLVDRYNYYFNNNETLCQSNCKFSDYLITTQYLKCECDISNSEIDTNEIKKFTPKILYQSFYDILKFSNYKVLKCYKLAFSINGLLKNKGSIMAMVYFILHLIVFIVYSCKGINQLKTDMVKKILNQPILSNNDLIKDNNIDINNKFDKNLPSSKEISIQTKSDQIKIRKKSFIKSSNKTIRTKINLNYPPKKKRTTIDGTSSKKKILKRSERKTQVFMNNLSNKELLINNKIIPKYKIPEAKDENINKEKEKGNSEINEESQNKNLDNFELNNLEYDLAIKLDKRDFLEIYWSILKREHLIFFTFFVRNDYNITFIKFSRFIFLVCTDMALNVFFFADETMHKMFLDYGKYNFYQQIPQIVYSTLVSQLIELLLCFLSLTDKHFYEIKNLGNSASYNVFKIIKCIKIKIAFFYCFTFIMFVFYWYVISCFCSVYENTQIAFIKDSISSFALGLLYPFVLYLMPATLRIIALRATKARCSCIYAMSDIIPFF